ncbi:M23 family metallopeptidase [Rathayibacter sp. VKM Ac-2630]|uniref:M23 family metallopeptidase n=1 Tax=Rathayibacter sp. VKM Ac-2630 TaxID=1938617 RepID=UPI0009826A23|nr:M23 family metallopeptidase [Rathayibacter sp. VKM Ac-2630]OOB91181.1 hypothetical protein B0T42_07215 [Rathayibacter sp. VKM Ac-2630]
MRIIKAARGRMTSPFGAKNVPGANVKSHGGTDWGHGNATKDDLRIVAPAAGTVTVAGWFGTYGNRIVIDHGRDENGDHWETLIAHLAEFLAEVGEWVEQAEEVGVMGNTGTKYVHCHQELRKNGRQVDPALYLVATGGGANTTPAQATDPQEDELPTTAQVWDEPQPSLGKNAPSIVLRDANSAAQEARDGVNDIKWVKHRNIDAPTDVVLADTLVTAQLGNAKLDALTAAVATLAASAGLDPARVEAAVESAVKDAVAGGIQISTTLSDDSLASIARAVADEQSRRLSQ